MAAANEAQPVEEPRGIESLTHGYRPQPGLFDEMVDAEGAVRPHWRALLERFDGLGRQELAARFAAADRYLRDSGVFYRVYDDKGDGERPWPLSHVPILISAQDWKRIKTGMLQRVGLIESILADCYGPQKLIAEGSLPAAAIAGSPEFLRPLVGATPAGGRYLGFYAADLGRSPGGDWWVIRDRAQAPSGAGYALENRNAMSRTLPEIYRTFGVERLAAFFEAFRGWMTTFREADDAGACLLTPGRMNETYFEHAYLARQLGFRLVEGQDLTVRDRRVYLRTIAGLRRVGALWRRVDADFCDPLELNRRSRLGVPGLVEAIRHDNVQMANELGAGLAEAQVLMGFLPALAKKLLGQPLALPNVATWWCGQSAERRYVLDNLKKLVVAPAFTARDAEALVDGPAVVAELDEERRRILVEDIERRGIDFVGQEVVKLSTTPVWIDGKLEPRPFMLRVYVAATSDGWNVMPGGFGLIGDRIDARAVTMQQGAGSADVWVLSEEEAVGSAIAQPASNMAARDMPSRDAPIRRATGALPSRAADNLFWMARYLARAEATLRVARALASRLSEDERGHRADTAGLVDILFKWGATTLASPSAAEAAAAQAMFGATMGGVPELVRDARETASAIRDRFPKDALQALDDLFTFVIAASSGERSEDYVLDKANTGLRIIAAIGGFLGENMNHLSGWRFLQLGHRIERAISTCRFTRQFGTDGAGPKSLDALLELAESVRTYRVRYMLGTARAPVLDLVLLDDANPRSLAFALADILVHLATLPNARPEGNPSPAISAVEALLAEVKSFEPANVSAERLIGIENGLMRVSNEISQTYFMLREPAAADNAGR